MLIGKVGKFNNNIIDKSLRLILSHIIEMVSERVVGKVLKN